MLAPEKIEALELKASEIRQDIIKMLVEAGSSHSAGPLGIAAHELEKEGVKVTVVNNHTIKPIDEETLTEIAKKIRNGKSFGGKPKFPS